MNINVTKIFTSLKRLYEVCVWELLIYIETTKSIMLL